MTIDTTEHGLETLIFDALTNTAWIHGDPTGYDPGHCVDLAQFSAFLKATQPEVAASLSLDSDTPTRKQFLERLNREVGRRGVIDVLRNGIKHLQHNVSLFYPTPTPGNETAEFLHQPEPIQRHPPVTLQQQE